VASGGGGIRKPQALENHELVLPDVLATVASKLASDNCRGEAAVSPGRRAQTRGLKISGCIRRADPLDYYGYSKLANR
jgi:hypothetical protein